MRTISMIPGINVWLLRHHSLWLQIKSQFKHCIDDYSFWLMFLCFHVQNGLFVGKKTSVACMWNVNHIQCQHSFHISQEQNHLTNQHKANWIWCLGGQFYSFKLFFQNVALFTQTANAYACTYQSQYQFRLNMFFAVSLICSSDTKQNEAKLFNNNKYQIE